MSDVVVTVPKDFTHPYVPGARGLVAWLGEGDAPGEPESGIDWEFLIGGDAPDIRPGERVYVVCEGRLVGYSPLTGIVVEPRWGGGNCTSLIRRGGAVACTILEPIRGFRGFRYRWWGREEEIALDLSAEIAAAIAARPKAARREP